MARGCGSGMGRDFRGAIHASALRDISRALQATGDRFNVNISFSKNWEHLQNKFVGTGHPDMTKLCVRGGASSLLFSCDARPQTQPVPPLPRGLPCSEWAVGHHRDSYASHIGHSDMLAVAALAENVSIGRVKYTMLERMLQPCGPPPVKVAGAGAE